MLYNFYVPVAECRSSGVCVAFFVVAVQMALWLWPRYTVWLMVRYRSVESEF
jgi:hypothetical protein